VNPAAIPNSVFQGDIFEYTYVICYMCSQARLNLHICVQVVEGYIEVVEPTAMDPIVLFQDDGPGHKDLAVLELCLKKYVHVFPGMPKLTHLWQIMDKLYRTWKTTSGTAAEALIKKKNKNTKSRAVPLSVYDVGELLRGENLTGEGGPVKATFTEKKYQLRLG
jgi:hypothetical protein